MSLQAQLPLDAPVRLSDPDTSALAAAMLDDGNDRALVLAALTDLNGRATADEITDHLNRTMDRNWQRSCVSSRLSQLRDPNRFDGAPPVEDSGIRRQSPSTGRPVIVFRTVPR